MKHLLLPLVLLLAACPDGQDSDTDIDSGTELDTEADTDFGTDTDVDSDSDADSDSDSDSDTEDDSDAVAMVPDFQLEDVNPTSPTASEPVSPRDYLQKVSGWYYTHAN